jgi:hypothetical protein
MKTVGGLKPWLSLLLLACSEAAFSPGKVQAL